MSSTHPHPPLQQQQQQQQVSSSSTEPTIAKKKFGKNLNKLTKPPAPPVPASSLGSVGGSSGVGGSFRGGFGGSTTPTSRSGLLLLSTKRASSGGSSASSSVGGGLLGSKSSSSLRPLTTTNLRSESESAHDALLTAAAAAAGRGEQPPQTQQQRAWGLGEKKLPQQVPPPVQTPNVATTPPASAPVPAPILAPRGGVSAGYHLQPTTQQNAAKHDGVSGLKDKVKGEDWESRGRVGPLPVKGVSQGRSKDSDEEGGMVSTDVSSLERGKRADTSRSLSHHGASRAANLPPPVDHTATPLVDQAHQSERKNAGREEKGAVDKPQEAEVSDNGKDDQVEFMARLARERAEKRRQEEEARMNAQRQRAAQRLMELEQKISSTTITNTPPQRLAHSGGHQAASNVSKASALPTIDPPYNGKIMSQLVPTSEKGKLRQRSGGKQSEIILERLGRPKRGSFGSTKLIASGVEMKPASVVLPGSNVTGRTLYDPNRTYSSLVGGSTAVRNTEANNNLGNKPGDTDTKQRIHFDSPSSPSKEPQNPSHIISRMPDSRKGSSNVTDDQVPVSIIQLSSYEDRDRGERKNASAPRMLFDPKSGAMVAAPSRDDGGSSGGKLGRKERNKQKSRTRERDETASNRPEAMQLDSESITIATRPNTLDPVPNELNDPRSSRRPRARKDEVLRKDRKRLQKDSRPPPYHASGFSDSPSSPRFDHHDSGTTFNKNRQNGYRGAHGRPHDGVVDKPRLPRTCGVLYKVDQDGNYICADGCEADQGYGAHSVPGGRVRNPVGHSKFLEMQHKLHSEAMSGPVSETRGDQHGSGEPYPNAGGPSSGRQQLYQSQHVGKRVQRRSSSHKKKDRKPQHQQQNQQVQHFVKFETSGQMKERAGFHNIDQDHLGANPHSGGVNTQPGGTSQEVEEENLEIPLSMRVKPNETIEILVGADESPTLQATADPWAPSEAALAAAAAVAAANVASTDNFLDSDLPEAGDDSDENAAENAATSAADMIINDDYDEDDDETENDVDLHVSPSFMGLGFDPTENMDSVITSPTLRADTPDKNPDPVDLTALTLESAGGDGTTGNNPFGPLGTPSQFLGSSTWGTGGTVGSTSLGGVSMGALTNWDDLLSGVNGDRETKQANGRGSISDGQKQAVTAASFLSLSPLGANESTWGTGGFRGGLAGLGGTSLGSAHSSTKSSGHDTD